MPLNGLLHHGIFRLGTPLLKGGPSARLSILIYHRVLPAPDPMRPYEVDIHLFRRQMSLIADNCHVLALPEAIRRLHEDSLPPRSVCITFDDGYRDNAEIALPILREFGLSATFFIATAYLDDGIMFNDAVIEGIRNYRHDTLDLTHRGLGSYPLADEASKLDTIDRLLPQVKYLPREQRLSVAQEIADNSSPAPPADLMMTRDQVLHMRDNGMTIGAHTRTHPILTRISDEDAMADISRGKDDLESILGQSVGMFAYPNGRAGQDYDERHVDMVRKAGFEAAVSTNPGVSAKSTDVYQLARFTPWDRPGWRFGIRLVQNGRRVA